MFELPPERPPLPMLTEIAEPEPPKPKAKRKRKEIRDQIPDRGRDRAPVLGDPLGPRSRHLPARLPRWLTGLGDRTPADAGLRSQAGQDLRPPGWRRERRH